MFTSPFCLLEQACYLWMMDISLEQFGLYLLIAMGVALLLVLLMFGLVQRKVKQLNVPPDAGFAETLLYTPLIVVIFIDLLDFGLDFLAAPVAWFLLDRWGLKGLRGVSALEAFIPFTQPIPTLTLAWVWVRMFGTEMLPNGR